MKSITIRFPEDTFESVKIMSRVAGVSFNSLVCSSVRNEIDSLMKDKDFHDSYFKIYKLYHNVKK